MLETFKDYRLHKRVNLEAKCCLSLYSEDGKGQIIEVGKGDNLIECICSTIENYLESEG